MPGVEEDYGPSEQGSTKTTEAWCALDWSDHAMPRNQKEQKNRFCHSDFFPFQLATLRNRRSAKLRRRRVEKLWEPKPSAIACPSISIVPEAKATKFCSLGRSATTSWFDFLTKSHLDTHLRVNLMFLFQHIKMANVRIRQVMQWSVNPSMVVDLNSKRKLQTLLFYDTRC